MLTDEELVQQISQRLHEELAEMYPADRVIHVWEEVEHPTASPVILPPRPHRRIPAIKSAVGVLAAMAALAIVVVAALALLGRHEQSHLGAADAREQPLLRILGVLRRAQIKADLPPALMRVLKLSAKGTLARAQGIPDLAGVRLATVTPEGERVFLIPVQPPAAAAISKLTPGLRAALRLDLERGMRQGGTLRIALMKNGQVAGVFGGGLTAKTIKHGPAGFLGGAPGLGANMSQLVQVVPDGVSKVTVVVPVFHQRGPTTITRITRQVHNNVVAVQLPEAPDQQGQTTIWYSPDGKVLRRFGKTYHPPTTHSATCSSGRRFLCGQPPRSITSLLGSLASRPSPGQRLSQDFLGRLIWQGSGIYVRYARSGKFYGVPYYLIPASNVGGKCCTGQPGVQLIIQYAGDEIHDYISLKELRDHVEPKSIQTGTTITPLVVPDQVASVTATYPAKGHIPHQIITEQVNDNIVIFRSRIMGGWDPPSLTYRSASGAVLWSHQAH
jgi:hypothetical protein